MRRATGHRVWLGAAVTLLFGLALTWGMLRFGAAETAILYRLFLFLSIPTVVTLAVPPRRGLTESRTLFVGFLGVLLLGLVILQPTLESRGSLHLAVGWIALWVGLWLCQESPVQRQLLIVVLVLLGALEAFYGLIQSIGGVDYIGDYFRNRGRIATGTLINRNHFAALLNMLLPLALGLLFAARARRRERPATRSESLAKTWVVLLGCSVIGVAVLLSQSRAGTLSMLLTLLFLALLLSLGRRKLSRRGLSALAAMVLIFLVIGMGAAFGLEALFERFGRLEDSLSRVEVYDDTLRMIGESPLIGVGPGMYRWTFRTYQTTQPGRLYDHAHNDYLETAVEWGVPLAVLVWGFVLWRLYRSSTLFLTAREAHHQGIALGTAGALLSILIHSLVDFSLQIPVILMVLACIVALSWSLDSVAVRGMKAVPGGSPPRTPPASERAAESVFGIDTGARASLALRALLLATLLTAGWVVLQRARATQWAQPEQGVAGLERAVGIDPEASEPHFLLGMAYRDLPGTGDPSSALEQLRAAVRLNPYAWRYWLELSRMQELMGQTDEAEDSLRIAVRLNPGSGAYRWRLANLLLRQDSLELSVAELIEAIRLEPHLAEPAVALLLKLGLEDDVIRQLLPTDRSALLRLSQTMISLARRSASDPGATPPETQSLLAEVWTRLSSGPEPVTLDEGRGYVDHLIRAGELEKARQLWIDLARVNGITDAEFEQGRNRVWNGGFELDLLGSPLGWRLGRSEAFEAGRSTAEKTDGSSSLEIEFLGTENLDFSQVVQVLILQPGASSRLSLWMRTESISTDQGVFIEVLAGQTNRIVASTEPILGTTEWAAYEVEFEAPEGSGRATIRLRRRPSQRLDNRLHGTVWLDSVRIEQVGQIEISERDNGQP